MDATIDTAWFRQKIADSPYVSQRRLARELTGKKGPLDPSALSLMLRGKRKMTLEEAQQLAELLKVPLDDVLRHAGLSLPAQRSYPITGWLDAAGMWAGLEEPMPTPGPDSLPPDATAAQVRAPGAPADGWVLFLDDVRIRPGPSALGRLGMVKLSGASVVLAFITRGYRPGTVNLDRGLPLGALEHMADAAVDWVSPVLLIQPA